MAFTEARQLVGTGIYSVAESARISGVSASRIRRWLRGYQFTTANRSSTSPPVWTPQLPEIDGHLALGFLDLLEVRFVDAFLRKGVSWPTIRKAGQNARRLFDCTHPFSSARFKTDGKNVFAELSGDSHEQAVIELGKCQQYFQSIIKPYLRGVQFEHGTPVRWWPLGEGKGVVIDPARSFGQPIISDCGIPTAVLASAVDKAGSVEEVARWYEVSKHSVELAKRYEDKLAA